jgi:GH25 family lysozyme M1 (1,4-beta-N-acetylmuramidase)
VDFETADKVQTEADLYADKEDLYKCLCEIERLTGMTPWLYVNYSAAFRLKFDKRFARFPAWFARYNSTLGPIPLPWTPETTGAWQYTEKGTFAGFKGGNDVNIYYGKVNAMKLK